MEANVISVPRPAEAADAFVLVHVSLCGNNPLQLKLVGTEGEGVYSVSINNKIRSGIKWRAASLGQSQLDQLLLHVFFGAESEDNPAAVTESYELVSNIVDETLIITIQKKIEGIIDKIGVITLPSDDEDISLFDWCGLALQSRQKMKDELKRANLKIVGQAGQMKALEDCNTELVRMKSEHDNEVLEKFTLLLNEKKLKIRDQQRLLSSVKDDPSSSTQVTMEETEEIRVSARPKPTRAVRGSKRKVAQMQKDHKEESDVEKSESEDQVAAAAARESEEKQRSTSEEASDATDSDDGPPAPAPLPPRAPATAPTDVVIPPKRQLPFSGRRKPIAKKAPSPVGSLTESDDEL